MQRLLDGLVAVNSPAKADVTKRREDGPRDGARAEAKRAEFICRFRCEKGRSPSVTTAAPNTTRSTTITAFAGSYTMSPSPVTSRAEPLAWVAWHQHGGALG
jgi:hypothetical protein